MSESASSTPRKLLKLIPGFAISAYFLWRVLRDLKLDRLRSMRLVHPVWVAVFLGIMVLNYALRSYRWWYMLRSVRASYRACIRVLMTSLAANNILPFRVGDFMRIFAYAPDVNAPSSTVLSTVLLERLLDIFMLFVFLVLLGSNAAFPPVNLHGHRFSVESVAVVLMVIAALGLGLLLFGTQLLQRITKGLVRRFGQHGRTRRLGEWAVLLFDAVLHLTILDRFWLLILTAGVWTCESIVFVSCAGMIGVQSGPRGPWLAAVISNLSFMLPSAPGGIGPFEGSAKLAMQTQGTASDDAALYAVLVHVLIILVITGVGGVLFLVHRAHRRPPIKPLTEDLAELPITLDVPETH